MDIRIAAQHHGKTLRVQSQENPKFLRDPQGHRSAIIIYEEEHVATTLTSAGQLSIKGYSNLGKSF